MKLRILVVIAALLTFSYAAPSSFSQDQGSPSPGVSGTPAPTDKTAAQTDNTPPTTPTVSPADPDKVKHDGGKNDVDAIGNRKMGSRGMGNWYTIETEIRMGTEYVNRIGQNLVRNSDAQVPFTIKVIDSDEINAMALPGGFFYVNSGLILAADEEAELAGVMAHETAHVCAHHEVREQTRMNYAQLGTIPLIFIGGWTGYGIYEAASIAVPITFMHFSREFEAQADYLGVQYMYKACYDPQAFISFF